MRPHESITTERVMAACKRLLTDLDDPGFCLACGADADGVEPDARKYKCEACGAREVYGAEECLMMLPI
jgi:predicted RNA-binding Zn-ribbon protein involved in translation (DUF1610 family)